MNAQIADLQPGSDVSGTYACTRKARLTGRNGAAFLQVELRDASGRIQGRAFRDVAFLDGQFEQGDVVQVRARVEEFRGERQLAIRSIERAPAAADAPLDLLPRAYRDLNELDGFLEHLAGEVYGAEYRALLEVLLGDDALRKQLRTAPCTRDGHHAYLGGLLEHTVAVAMLAQQTCELHRKLNADLLITAAIVHDIGKTEEFKYGAEIAYSEAGRLVGHLQLGADVVRELAKRAGGIDDQRLLPLLHCVLSHHGPQQGQRFGSAEALALYRANALDASVKGALEHGALASDPFTARSGDGVGGSQSATRHAVGDVKA